MNNKDRLLEYLEKIWDKEVVPWIRKYYEIIGIEEIIKCYDNTYMKLHKEECEQLLERKKREVGLDPLAPWYISQMGSYVEHDLADGRKETIPLRIYQVLGTLNDRDYYKNVYGVKIEEIEEKISTYDIHAPQQLNDITEHPKIKSLICLRMIGKKLKKLWDLFPPTKESISQ